MFWRKHIFLYTFVCSFVLKWIQKKALVHKPELQEIGSSLYHYLASLFIYSCSELSTRNLTTFSLTVHMVWKFSVKITSFTIGIFTSFLMVFMSSAGPAWSVCLHVYNGLIVLFRDDRLDQGTLSCPNFLEGII